MIDPKFNEIPADDAVLTEAERKARSRAPQRGLSINETIAREANLSVGAKGVDTSGVSSGAGAGAGSTILTPDEDYSPAPHIVPGERSNKN